MGLLFDIGTLIVTGLLALAVAGVLAPLETLGWWAGWYGDQVEPEPEPWVHDPTDLRTLNPPDPWIVILNGIHAVGSMTYDVREVHLVAKLRAAFPRGRVVEVFPYSVTARPLIGDRVFASVWRWVLSRKQRERGLDGLIGFFINIRNLWQVLVSADHRYGPFYNRGAADVIQRSLARRGFRPGPETHLVLVGYSGGGQVAIGAAAYLRRRTQARITLVSLAGVMASNPGLLAADRVVHLYGSADRVHGLGDLLFPGRWRWNWWSSWNVARRLGRLEFVEMGPFEHTGRKGYLDEDLKVGDGRNYMQVTVDVIAAVIRGQRDGLPVAGEAEAPGAPAGDGSEVDEPGSMPTGGRP